MKYTGVLVKKCRKVMTYYQEDVNSTEGNSHESVRERSSCLRILACGFKLSSMKREKHITYIFLSKYCDRF